VVHQAKDLRQSAAIAGCDFIRVHSSKGASITFSRKLDRGEQEALALAVTLNADFILLDDKRAQKKAVALHLSFLPTFALLAKAAQKGIVSNLDVLQQKNIFLSRELSLTARTFVVLS
jgi:predicted nucleic acid-binding protein